MFSTHGARVDGALMAAAAGRAFREGDAVMQAVAASCAPPEPSRPALNVILERIQRAAERLGNCREKADDLADRLFGPVPTEARQAGNSAGSNCAMAIIGEALDRLEGEVVRIHDAQNRLDRL